MKLLIADRSARMRELIKQICCEAGDEVCECPNAATLIGQCSTQPRLDCVILDEGIAGDDFRGVIHRLRSMLPGTPIVVMSLDPNSWFQQIAAEAGVSACVAKDDLRQLRQIIRAAGGIGGSAN